MVFRPLRPITVVYRLEQATLPYQRQFWGLILSFSFHWCEEVSDTLLYLALVAGPSAPSVHWSLCKKYLLVLGNSCNARLLLLFSFLLSPFPFPSKKFLSNIHREFGSDCELVL